MTPKLQFPPLEYTLLVGWDDEGEPDQRQRTALTQVAARWNRDHTSQFSWQNDSDLDALSLVLPRGVSDSEFDPLERELAAFEHTAGVQAARSVLPRVRTDTHHATADFVQCIGESGPPGFVVNAHAGSGPRGACDACGLEDGVLGGRPLLRPLLVDSAALRRHFEAEGTAVPDLVLDDLGRSVISMRLARHLEKVDAHGIEVIEVIDAASHKPSEEYALLRAQSWWRLPCSTHTPRHPDGCLGCGRGGQHLAEPHLSSSSVDGADVLATDPTGFHRFYISRRLLVSLRAAGLGPLTIHGSFGLCDCDAAPLPRTMPLPAPSRSPTATLEEFIAFVRHPHPAAWVRRCRPSTDPRHLPLMHRLGHGASAEQLERLEHLLPAAVSFRPLLEHIDGIEFFTPRTPDRALPCLDDARMDPCAALRIERCADWLRLRHEMQTWAAGLDHVVTPLEGIPFATVPASSDLLVWFEGRVYYVSPLYNGLHNQVIADGLPAFFGLVRHHMAQVLMDGAAVVATASATSSTTRSRSSPATARPQRSPGSSDTTSRRPSHRLHTRPVSRETSGLHRAVAGSSSSLNGSPSKHSRGTTEAPDTMEAQGPEPTQPPSASAR